MTNSRNIKKALDRIAEVRKNKLLYLDLQGLSLSEIPEDISDLIFIQELDLSFNNFTTLPLVIEKLINLRHLNIKNNNIFYLGLNFDKHVCLKEIDFSFNSINLVPNELDYFSGRTSIIYEGNPFLNNLPSELDEDRFFDVCYYIDLIKNENETYRFYETKLIFVGKGEVGKTTLTKTIANDSFEFIVGNESVTHGININSIIFKVLFPAWSPYYKTFTEIENVYLLLNEEHYCSEENENENENDSEYYLSNIQIDTDFDDFEKYKTKPIIDILHHYEDEINDLVFLDDLTIVFGNAVIEKEVILNVWDFGGQEIYHTTHQFFLTKRSIYLFVWEPRKDYNQDDFEYWLNTIKLVSANSPVIVVMNKADIRHINIDKSALQANFPNISAIIEVSCKTKEGINRLKDEIRKCIRALPHMGDKLPKSWIKLRNEIKAKQENFITLTDFLTISNRFVNVNDRKEIELLSEYLHDIGEIIHFKDDFTLRNIVIINPQWATKAVYELIDTTEIQKNNGVFNLFELEKYWNLSIYPSEIHNTIVQLMEKFEICFKVVGAKDLYVIPELLKTEVSNPELIDEIEADESMKLQIEYTFMPSGIITKLICKLYTLIYKDSYWKNGAIFKDELSLGYIINDSPKRTISIVVSGKQKGNLLAIIRNELKNIHISFNMSDGVEFKEKIPCICDECKSSKNPYYFNYDVLKKFIIKEKLSIPCNYSTETVDILKMINGYSNMKPVKKIIYQILSALSQLQGQNKNIKPNEDARNSFVKDRLSINGVIAKDQSLWGKSGTGINQGKLDIKIEDEMGNIMTLYEGLNLENLDKTSIKSHIDKSIHNYDPNGIYEKFLGIYYNGNSFEQFSESYFTYINDLEKLDETTETNNLSEYSEIVVFKSSYKRTGRKLFLYHILVNMN